MEREYVLFLLDQYSQDAYFILNKRLVASYGPEYAVYLTILINQMRYQITNQTDKEYWFYYKHDHQVLISGMKVERIRILKNRAKDDGFLTTKLMGIPSKEWYYVHIDKLTNSMHGIDINTELSRVTEKTTPWVTETFEATSIIRNKNRTNNSHECKMLHIGDHFPKEWQDNPKFAQAIQMYEQSRKELKHPKLGQTGISALVNKLTKHSIEVAIQALEDSVSNGYQGVFPKGGMVRTTSTAQSNRKFCSESSHQHIQSRRWEDRFK
jgi:hypothetical protein